MYYCVLRVDLKVETSLSELIPRRLLAPLVEPKPPRVRSTVSSITGGKLRKEMYGVQRPEK